MKRTLALLLVPTLMLAACSDDATSSGEVDDGAAAEGEVLGGSISDEMLPLDRLESQSPPLREAREAGDSPDGARSAPQNEGSESETAPPAEANEAASETASASAGDEGAADGEDD